MVGRPVAAFGAKVDWSEAELEIATRTRVYMQKPFLIRYPSTGGGHDDKATITHVERDTGILGANGRNGPAPARTTNDGTRLWGAAARLGLFELELDANVRGRSPGLRRLAAAA